jgi:hypothetical protein
MTRRTVGILAVQAAVVGVLVAIVVVTLLAPEENDPLFDVSVPPEPSQVAPQGPRGDEGRRGDEGTREQRSGEPGGAPQERPPAAPSGPAEISPDAAAPPIAAVPAPPAEPAETPTGDQYADAVARILGEL